MLYYYILYYTQWLSSDHPSSQICPWSELVVVGTRPLGLAFSAAFWRWSGWGFPMDFPWISGFNLPENPLTKTD